MRAGRRTGRRARVQADLTMNKTMVTLLLLFSLAAAYSRLEKRNAIILEYGGSGGLYSLNYDRIVASWQGTHRLGFRAGASWLPLSVYDISVATFPATVNYLLGKRAVKFELDLGVVGTIVTVKGATRYGVSPAAGAGIRYVQRGSGSNFRLLFTPVMFKGVYPWLCISVGRSF